jgi:hypothetical protein
MRIANCRKGTSLKNSQCEFSPSWYSSATEEHLGIHVGINISGINV